MAADWSTRRKTPYTQIGMSRLKCVRCGGQAVHQWQVCADDNTFRPLCLPCDVELNRLVLTWAGHPNVDEAIERYEQRSA